MIATRRCFKIRGPANTPVSGKQIKENQSYILYFILSLEYECQRRKRPRRSALLGKRSLMPSNARARLLKIHILYLDHGPIEIPDVNPRRLETRGSGQRGAHCEESHGKRNIGGGSAGG